MLTETNHKRLSLILLTALFLLLATTAVLSMFIQNIQYHSNVSDYLDPADSRVSDFHRIVSSYQLDNRLLAMIKVHDGPFLQEKHLKSLYKLHSDLAAAVSGIRADSILTTPVTTSDGQSITGIDYLNRNLPVNNAFLGQLADNSLRFANLVAVTGSGSARGTVATLQVTFTDKPASEPDYAQVIETIRATAGNETRWQIHTLGRGEIKHALHQALLHDGIYLMPFVLLLGLALMIFFLRRPGLIITGVLSIVPALLITAGLVGKLGITVNQTSALAFGIVFIISLADVIHLLTGTVKLIPDSRSVRHAANHALCENFPALLVTSITTALGFASLNLGGSPVFADFGNIAAMGVLVALLSAVSVIPVLAPLVTRNITPPGGDEPAPEHRGQDNPINRSFTALLAAYRHLPKSVTGMAFCIILVAIAGNSLNEFHNDPGDYFRPSSPVTAANNLAREAFQYHHQLLVQLAGSNREAIFSRQYLKTLRDFRHWLDNREDVTGISDFTDTLQTLNTQLHQNQWKWHSDITSAARLADLWNLYQMASPDNNAQRLGIDKDFSAAMVTVTTPYLSSGEVIALAGDIRNWFDRNAPELRITVSGHSLMFAAIGQDLSRNMLLGGLLSAMVISLLIGVFLGNIRLGFVSLIPNLLPALVVFGIWGYVSGVIDLAAAGTLAISLGIVVDDSIHILKRYVHYRKLAANQPWPQGSKVHWAIGQSFQHVGSALILTTLIISAGMGVLMFSVFIPNQTTAILLTGIIALALLFDLIMLPKLLLKLDAFLFPGQSRARIATQTANG